MHDQSPTLLRSAERMLLNIQLYSIVFMALSTGALEATLGVSSQNLFGAGMSPTLTEDPFLNSQFRFIAIAWFGTGALLLTFLRDMARFAAQIRVVLVLIMLGGLSRFATAIQFGMPEDALGHAYLLSVWSAELLGAPLALLLLHRATRSEP